MRGENESPVAQRSNSVKASDGSLTTSLTTSADQDARGCGSPPPGLANQLQRRYHKRRSPAGQPRNARHVTTTASEGSENEDASSSRTAPTAGSGSGTGSDSDPSRLCYMVITVAGSVSREDFFQPSHLVSHRVITANGSAGPSCGLPEGWSDTLTQRRSQAPTLPQDADSHQAEQNPPLPPPRPPSRKLAGACPVSTGNPRRSRLLRSDAVDYSPVTRRKCSSNPASCHNSPDLAKRPPPEVRTLPSARLLDERVDECYLPPKGNSKTLPDALHRSRAEDAVNGACALDDEKYVRILSLPHSMASPRFRGTSFLVTCCGGDNEPPPPPAPRSHLQSSRGLPADAPPRLPPRDRKPSPHSPADIGSSEGLAVGNITNGVHFQNIKQQRVGQISSSELSASRRSASLSDLLHPQPLMLDDVRPKLNFSRQRSVSATQVTEERCG